MQLYRYNEPLEDDELAFLQRKEGKERQQFYKLIRMAMIVAFVVPFIMTWVNALSGKDNPFSYGYYFASTGIIMLLSGGVVYMVYHNTLQVVQRDISHATKTIELTHISRKQYMAQNNSFHFYLTSPTRLSIEVSEKDYHRLDEGDEVNIEYTTYSKMYLGYF
jgi:hypothetical protein